MILQALHDYYVRKSADEEAQIAPAGFEWKEIPFIIELSRDAEVIQIEDTRQGEGKKKVARKFLIPQGVKKTSGVAANLLWDNAEYVLGVDIRGKPERVREQHNAFVERIHALPSTTQNDPGVNVVLRFLGSLGVSSLERFPVWAEIVESNPNLSFRLHGEIELICQRPAVVATLQADQAQDKTDGFCLITGVPDEIERLHTSIKGVWGAQSSGANIVSFSKH